MLRQAADKLTAAMKKQRTLTDVDSDRADGGAEVYVKVDRDAATRLGVSAQAVDNALYDAFGQRQVSTIYSGLNQYHVVMGVAPEYMGTPEALEQVYVPGRGATATASTTSGTGAASNTAGAGTTGTSTTTGATTASTTASATTTGTTSGVTGSTPVSTTGQRDTTTGSAVNTSAANMMPLSTIATWATGSTDSQINHDSGAPATTISFSTATGTSLGQASETITQLQKDLHLPVGVVGSFAGTAKVFQQSTASMPVLILSALLVIYIVLGILYESAIHPLTVLSTLPSAGVGAVIALMLTGSSLDLIGLIGLILLIGIVKKNAIMIIDFALDAERTRGLSPMQAIREASLLRFRPILMTTLAAAFGALPLAIGFGEGAELRRPLGIAIMGGLLASQFLTLLTTPVVYLALDKFRRRSPRERMLARLGSEGLPV
jgi:multidrug efflux pump